MTTYGLDLPEDCVRAGWDIVTVEHIAADQLPPSIRKRSDPPPVFRAYAAPDVPTAARVPALPWVRDYGVTPADAVANLAGRLRQYWIMGDGRAGMRP